MVDWYRRVLDSDALKGKYSSALLESIRNRLDAQQLTSADINVLLAVAQLMSRDHEYRDDDQKRLAPSLSNPRFYSSVFVDEVQDFTEIEVFLMSTMADPARGAVTVVGDFMQQLYAGTVVDLRSCFPYSQSSELEPARLTENKRQVPNLAAFSANFRRQLGDESIPKQVVPNNIPELQRETVSDAQLGERIGQIVGQIPTSKSIAVISPSAPLASDVESRARPFVQGYFRESRYSADNRDLVKRIYVHFTEPRPTKGLEFDVVIITHFNGFDLKDPLHAHGAYVAVTRPRERLVLLDIR